MKKWKTIVKQHDGLREAMATRRQQLGGMVFDRVKLLSELFADNDFRADNRLRDDAQAGDFLDSFVTDLGQPFFALRAAYQHSPERSQWEVGSVFELCLEAVAAEESAVSAHEGTGKKRPRIKREDFEQVQVELEVERKQRQSTVADLQQAQQRIAELERDLARAEGRIAELERVMRGELAAA